MGIRRIVYLFITNLISIIGSLLMVFAEFYLIINIFGYVYEINNPVPNGVDDLGIGFVGLAAVIVSFFFSIPVFYFSYRFIYKITIKYIGEKLC